MREFQEKRKIKRGLYSKISIAVLLIVLFFVGRAVWNVYGKERQSALLEEQSEAKLADLQATQNQLSTENSQLSTPQGVEDQIREDYHMIKPGEQLAVIVGEPTSTPAEASQGQGFWATILHWIERVF